MRYYEFSEILSAVLAALAYGAVYGSISIALPLVIGVVCTLLELPKLLFTKSAKLTLKECAAIPRRVVLLKGALLHTEDFITVLLFGIGLLIINYAYCDGVFRLFVLVISVGSAVVARNSFGAAIKRLILAIYCATYALALKLLLVALIPLKTIMGFLYTRLAFPVCLKLVGRLSAKWDMLLKRKKLNAADKLFRWQKI